jgi:hypothetical protein
MSVSTSQTKGAKTVKAIATIDGVIHLGFAKFLFALGTDGAWRVRITNQTRQGDQTNAWAVCESPLAALGLTSEQLTGDVAFKLAGRFSNVPGLGDFAADTVFATGDIGHRVRLPRL